MVKTSGLVTVSFCSFMSLPNRWQQNRPQTPRVSREPSENGHELARYVVLRVDFHTDNGEEHWLLLFSCWIVSDSWWPHKDCSAAGSPVLHCLLEFAQIHVHWVMMLPIHLILYHPLLLLPSIFPALMDISKDGIQISSSNMRCNETSIGAL